MEWVLPTDFTARRFTVCLAQRLGSRKGNTTFWADFFYRNFHVVGVDESIVSIPAVFIVV